MLRLLLTSVSLWRHNRTPSDKKTLYESTAFFYFLKVFKVLNDLKVVKVVKVVGDLFYLGVTRRIIASGKRRTGRSHSHIRAKKICAREQSMIP